MLAGSVIARVSAAPLILFGIVLLVFAAIASIVGVVEGIAMDRLLSRASRRAKAMSAGASG